MHLKSIALQGFKTFAARTTLELRPGITAIVGPNGSGKSNIADAVRWALGETNLRHVRCRTTDELIFAGNARRSSVGFAEVSLVFANEGNWLDLPFSEVRVTRRANRSGENEYLLNGACVRLRDVVDVLAGASIHAGSHVVVSQGLVDAVLALRAEERRPLVENLAGLKQYYLRRDDAEGQLQGTEANLLHVDAMLAELAPQLAALSTQADALREYRAVVEELQLMQRLTFGAQAARLLDRETTVREVAVTREVELSAARGEAERLRAEDDRLLGALADDRARCDRARGEIDAARGSVEAARRDRDVAMARATSVEERAAFARAEYQRVLATRDAERVVLLDARSNLLHCTGAAAEADAALAARRRLAGELGDTRDSALTDVRHALARQAESAHLVVKIADAATAARTAIERLGAELDRHERAFSTATITLDEVHRAYVTAEAEYLTRRKQNDAARSVENDARARLTAARAASTLSLAEHQRAVRAAEQLATRLSVVGGWVRSLEGCGTGVRALLPAPGAAGIVSRLLRIDQSWHEAVALALGARFDAILADDPVALFRAWQARDGARGHVQLLVVGDTARDAERASPYTPSAALGLLREWQILAEDEVLGWACQVTSPAAAIASNAAIALERILLVADAAAVLRCARYTASLDIAVVSRDPAIAALADGSLVFGLDERVAESIARVEELFELEKGQDAACADEAVAAERLAEARQALDAAAHDVEAARSVCGKAESAAARARDEFRFQERLLRQAEQAAASLGPQIARCRADLADLHSHLDDSAERLEDARAVAAQRRLDADNAGEAARFAEQNVAAAHAARRDDEAALALLRDRERTASRLVDDQTRRLRALEADLIRHAEQERQTNATLAELIGAREAAVAREAAAAAVLARAEATLRPIVQRVHCHETAHASLRDALRRAAERLTHAEVAYERARRDADAVARDLEVLRAHVSAELDCTIDELPSGTPPPGAVARVKVLRAAIAAIGPVNAHAADDLLSTRERLDFLRAQSTDLRDGVARLRGMITDANATVRERFTQTVEALDGHFAQFFRRLFGGGSCRLIPEYDAQGQPTGVDIQAQPPGKRTRDLALLSGGERALVALALLFAMLRVRPVPFCLLDEVEAALDEANTGRFGAILRELSVGTQFILVTHNRGTMLHADRLYGITMGESGISTVASLALAGAGPAGQASTNGLP